MKTMGPEEATALFCPLIRDRCVATSCMAWRPVWNGDYSHQDGNPDQVIETMNGFVDRGLKIEAIKLLRAYSGLGLKESKDHVEFGTYSFVIRELSSKRKRMEVEKGYCSEYGV